MPTPGLWTRHDNLVQEIKKARKKLKPSSSYDSDFWSSKADLLAMDSERVSLFSSLEFREYKKSGGDMSRSDWEAAEAKARELVLQSLALKQQEKIARLQAEKLKISTSLQSFCSSFIKLFNSSKLGFGIEATAQKGRRDTNDQSKIRALMITEYCPGRPATVWEPVLGTWISAGEVTAAHLFPWRSADMMDTIFGQGSRNDLFTSANGLLLHNSIEQAFDKGYLVIVPDRDIEPKEPLRPWKDQEARRQRLKEWEATNPKDYKVVVLDARPTMMKEIVFPKQLYGIDVETLAELDGRHLRFLNGTRPRSRYVWWTYLAAITQLGWREGNAANTRITNEVLKGTRYWGTQGRYVKKNQLLGFVEQIGHDVSSIATESIMEHAIEEDESVEPQADVVGVAVMADHVVRRTQEDDGFDYEDEQSSEEEEEDEEWPWR